MTLTLCWQIACGGIRSQPSSLKAPLMSVVLADWNPANDLQAMARVSNGSCRHRGVGVGAGQFPRNFLTWTSVSISSGRWLSMLLLGSAVHCPLGAAAAGHG